MSSLNYNASKANMITALIITKNEEVNIGSCLSPLLKVADEILVLDSHSRDRTREIAREFQARVVQTEWLGYGATKNKGAKLASYPWILSIDADEVLDEELIASILAEKSKKLNGIYSINRLSYFGTRPIYHCGWHPEWRLRLYHREEAEWNSEGVHEKLVLHAAAKEHKLSGLCHHYTVRDIHDYLSRIDKYSSLSAEEGYAKGEKASLFKGSWNLLRKFLSIYIMKGGYRESYVGFAIAAFSGWARLLKQLKLKEKYQKQP